MNADARVFENPGYANDDGCPLIPARVESRRHPQKRAIAFASSPSLDCGRGQGEGASTPAGFSFDGPSPSIPLAQAGEGSNRGHLLASIGDCPAVTPRHHAGRTRGHLLKQRQMDLGFAGLPCTLPLKVRNSADKNAEPRGKARFAPMRGAPNSADNRRKVRTIPDAGTPQTSAASNSAGPGFSTRRASGIVSRILWAKSRRQISSRPRGPV